MDIALYTAAVFLAVVALVPVLRRIAIMTGFVDRPGGRKQHDKAVPPIGGLAVFPVFIVAMFITGLSQDHGWFFAALGLLLLTGALDDRFHVPAWTKFAVQFLAAFMVVMADRTQIISLGDLFGFGELWMGWMAIPFSVIAVVLLINAVNLMDGLDGLAGGMSFIIFIILAVCALAVGNQPYFGMALTLAAVMAGFLAYNLRTPWRKQASIFLGDSGSLALGLTLAWIVIQFSQWGDAVVKPIAVAWLLALPIYDICGQFARRVSQGRHPFDADRDHFHHHFVHAGLSDGQATAMILFVVFIMSMIGVGGVEIGVPEWVLTYIWIVLLFAHIYMSMRPHRFRQMLSRLLRGKGDD